MTSQFDLSGKVAVITGSTRGIGRAIAEAMARAGAKVVVSSRKADKCEEVTKQLRDEGLEAVGIPCHVAKKEDLERLVTETRSQYGKIDSLVCNAAINPHFGPMSTLTDDVFDKVVNANLRSKIWLCNMVLPEMAERGDGSVIVVSSIGGFRGSSMIGLYCITKAADQQLVRNLAVEWGPKNVRVNSIAPGLVRTDFARALWENPKMLARAEQGTPLRRIGDPDDIAGAAVFLASRAGDWMTGQDIVIDGGASTGEI